MLLQSGLNLEDSEARLVVFLAEEWAYYDGIADPSPDTVTPVDVLVTSAVNAFSFGGGAANIRAIHIGLASACDPLLAEIPIDADLRSFEQDELLERLLHRAVQIPKVLLPVATKVLFRKRRDLIPMLDNVILAYYLEALGKPTLVGRSQERMKAAQVGMVVLDAFRRDLSTVWPELQMLSARAGESGRPVGPLRILELLVWCQVEPRGYYR